MKFIKPLGTVTAKKTNLAPKSFGEKRAMQMNSRLAKTQQERKTLLQKEYVSPDPLNKAYQQKGNRLDAQIRKLKDER